MAAGAVPVSTNRTAQLGREPFQGHDAAPGHQSGELRLGDAEHVRAQSRMHTVCTDHQVAFSAPAILALEHGTTVAVAAGDGTACEMNGPGPDLLYRLPQDAMKVATVHHPIRGAKTLQRIQPQIEELPALPSVPESHLFGRRLRHYLSHGRP